MGYVSAPGLSRRSQGFSSQHPMLNVPLQNRLSASLEARQGANERERDLSLVWDVGCTFWHGLARAGGCSRGGEGQGGETLPALGGEALPAVLSPDANAGAGLSQGLPGEASQGGGVCAALPPSTAPRQIPMSPPAPGAAAGVSETAGAAFEGAARAPSLPATVDRGVPSLHGAGVRQQTALSSALCGGLSGASSLPGPLPQDLCPAQVDVLEHVPDDAGAL